MKLHGQEKAGGILTITKSGTGGHHQHGTSWPGTGWRHPDKPNNMGQQVTTSMELRGQVQAGGILTSQHTINHQGQQVTTSMELQGQVQAGGILTNTRHNIALGSEP